MRVVELGPGRGTLLADALRAWSQFPAMKDALRDLRLVETSQTMRKLQKETLEGALEVCRKKGMGVDEGAVGWHDSLDELREASSTEDVFTMVVAHEFFDALPVHVIEVRCSSFSS